MIPCSYIVMDSYFHEYVFFRGQIWIGNNKFGNMHVENLGAALLLSNETAQRFHFGSSASISALRDSTDRSTKQDVSSRQL